MSIGWFFSDVADNTEMKRRAASVNLQGERKPCYDTLLVTLQLSFLRWSRKVDGGGS